MPRRLAEERMDRSCPKPRAMAVSLYGNILGTWDRVRRSWHSRETNRAGSHHCQTLLVAPNPARTLRGLRESRREHHEGIATWSLWREKRAQGSAVLSGRLLPIFLDRIPSFAEAFLVSIAILRNDG